MNDFSEPFYMRAVARKRGSAAPLEPGDAVVARDWPGVRGEVFVYLGPDRPSPRYGPTVRLLDSNHQVRTLPADRVRRAPRRRAQGGARASTRR